MQTPPAALALLGLTSAVTSALGQLFPSFVFILLGMGQIIK
jgi:hypothetical protein